MAARGISTDGGPPAWAVESCCLDGRVGLAKQQGKRVAHRLSKWPTDMEIDGTYHCQGSAKSAALLFSFFLLPWLKWHSFGGGNNLQGMSIDCILHISHA